MTAKRYYKKIGDIFTYKFNGKLRYMQYLAIDELQLFGDVVRVFKGLYNDEMQLNVEDIVELAVDFCCITYVSNCVKIGNWVKIGNSKTLGDIYSIKFRCASDYGSLVNGEPIKISNNWYGWNLGDKNQSHLGSLVGDWRDAYIGDLLPPQFINERLECGEYKFFYPLPE